jgi:hypothetical protein
MDISPVAINVEYASILVLPPIEMFSIFTRLTVLSIKTPEPKALKGMPRASSLDKKLAL